MKAASFSPRSIEAGNIYLRSSASRWKITAPACWRVRRRHPQYVRHDHGVVKRSRKLRQRLGNFLVGFSFIELELSKRFGESNSIDGFGDGIFLMVSN